MFPLFGGRCGLERLRGRGGSRGLLAQGDILAMTFNGNAGLLKHVVFVGAGLLAMRPVSPASTSRPPSPASRLLQVESAYRADNGVSPLPGVGLAHMRLIENDRVIQDLQQRL